MNANMVTVRPGFWVRLSDKSHGKRWRKMEDLTLDCIITDDSANTKRGRVIKWDLGNKVLTVRLDNGSVEDVALRAIKSFLFPDEMFREKGGQVE